MEDEFYDGKSLILNEVDEDVVDDDCNRDASMPVEWMTSNDDAAPVRCMLMNKDVVVDVYVDDEVVVENHLDTVDGQVDVEDLDIKAQLLDLDVPHTNDVFQGCIH